MYTTVSSNSILVDISETVAPTFIKIQKYVPNYIGGVNDSKRVGGNIYACVYRSR